MTTAALWVYAREPAVHTLGPGTRYGLWVSGCHRRCPGCISKAAWDKKAGKAVLLPALVWEILHAEVDGITVSGGEPFLQAELLAELLREVHNRRPELSVIVYTGYTLVQLQKKPEAAALLQETDLLIDGEYKQELDDGKSLRGSSNQQIIARTKKGEKFRPYYGVEGREHETVLHAGIRQDIGIPQEKGGSLI